MKIIPRGGYSKEFREEAIKHVAEQGLSIPEASSRLDIPKSTVNYWMKPSKAGNLKNIGNSHCEFNDIEMELEKLRRELTKV